VKKGKRYVDICKIYDKKCLYEPEKAFEICVQTAKAKFDESIEVHIKLGIDSRHADQQVRGSLILPFGKGKNIKVLAICKNEDEALARNMKADYVGAEDVIDKIQNEGWLNFDVVVTTPNMMSLVGKLGKILGPRGLMPNPKSGTVATDIGKAVAELKAGKIEYRPDKSNIIHCSIGKASFDKSKLVINFNALFDAVLKSRPEASKGQYIRSCFISATMGPGIKVNISKIGYSV